MLATTASPEISLAPIDRVLLIPGLMEPRMAMLPLRQRLRKRGLQADIWRDCYAFRNVQWSINALLEQIDTQSGSTSIAIITHSFGDWVARKAISRADNHRVGALVSLAPVMARGCIPTAMHYVGGDFIPEIRIIADREQAPAALNCDPGLRRLVLWAAIDLAVRSIDLSDLPNTEVQRVAATHLSIVLQPGVHRMIERFLFPVTGNGSNHDQQSPRLPSPDGSSR